MFSRVFGTFFVLISVVLGVYGAAETRVVIMHTNGIRGHILPGPASPGSARLATVVREMKPDLMLDAGDMLSGALISDAFQGEPLLEIMNAIGYDAATIGVNEFNFGIEALRARILQANFPVLSANTTTPISDIQDAAIYNAQGVRLAIIGLTSEEIAKTGHPQNVKYVDVADVVRTLENLLPRVRDRVDSIILLTNVTRTEEERLARAFPEIRLIIGAHEVADLPVRIGQTTIVGAGSLGRYVGRLDLTFNDGRLNRIEPRLIPLQNVEPDPGIAGLIGPYEAALNKKLQTVLGH